MLKRGLLSLALIATAVLFTGTSAQAIPPGESLLVIAYYSDSSKTQVIGQKWSGCGQAAGSWGATSGFQVVYFTPC